MMGLLILAAMIYWGKETQDMIRETPKTLCKKFDNDAHKYVTYFMYYFLVLVHVALLLFMGFAVTRFLGL